MHASLGLLERGASSGKPAASDHILAFAEERRRHAKSTPSFKIATAMFVKARVENRTRAGKSWQKTKQNLPCGDTFG